MKNMHISLRGVRGSVPIHGSDFALYGGATSCVYVKAGDEYFVLDAGSGLVGAQFDAFSQKSDITMLISHPHADHLVGFPMFTPIFDKSRKIDIYLKTRGGKSAREQIETLVCPPLWPINTSMLGATVNYHDVPESFTVGDVKIETLDVHHPGGCTAYKLTRNGVSLVWATDIEAGEDEAEFVRFAHDCELLLLDAQYTSEEYMRTKGFGHTTVDRAISLAHECGAKNTIFIHHDPTRTDKVLSKWDESLSEKYPTMHFGRAGEEVIL